MVRSSMEREAIVAANKRLSDYFDLVWATRLEFADHVTRFAIMSDSAEQLSIFTIRHNEVDIANVRTSWYGYLEICIDWRVEIV